MAVWSMLTRAASKNFQKSRILVSKFNVNNVISNSNADAARKMSNAMVITASRWQWHKTKDYVHFYFLIAAIPLSILVFCVNIFVGPATLTEIPEGYEPKYWEYYRHPISRFISRYIMGNPQREYEKVLHVIYEESQLIKVRKLEDKIWKLQEERQDYRYNYFLPYDMFLTREFRGHVRHARDDLE